MGQAVQREEDPRLLRGEGAYIADLVLPRLAYGHVLRSPHAHARIVAIDVGTARRCWACSVSSPPTTSNRRHRHLMPHAAQAA